MSNRVNITSSAHPYEMSSWCTEKTSTIVRGLARLAEIVQESANEQAGTHNTLLTVLYPVAYDATKMLAFSCGADWSHEDRDILLKGGEYGYEQLAVKYGLIKEPPGQERVFDRQSFVTLCRGLLKGDRAPNRTLLHELIARARFHHPLLKDLDAELESVTMGIKEWSGFVLCASELLSEIESMPENQ